MSRAARYYLAALTTAVLFVAPALGDTRQEICKAAMNARIQRCTEDCTARALAAVPEYKDTDHNVTFGCMKGCAVGQVLQMRACADGKDAPPADPTETNGLAR